MLLSATRYIFPFRLAQADAAARASAGAATVTSVLQVTVGPRHVTATIGIRVILKVIGATGIASIGHA